MKRKPLHEKLHNDRGVNRLVAILATLVIVLALAAIYPACRAYKKHADEVGCMAAMKKAQDMLDVEYLMKYSLTYEEAVAVAERSKWEMDTVCPAGGDYYLVEREDNEQKYRIVCGLHDADACERTRLNARAVYGLLTEALSASARAGETAPERVTVTINGRTLEVERLDEPNELRYGTKSTTGYKGTVAYYSLAEDGSLFWFVYADELHAAVWRATDTRNVRIGWSGDAFSG